LGYGDVSELLELLEEVSKLLEAYARSIPNSGFWILTSDYLSSYQLFLYARKREETQYGNLAIKAGFKIDF